MLLDRQEAWLRAYFFSREHQSKVSAENAQVGALAFADKLLVEFDRRFPPQKIADLEVTTAVSDAMQSFAGMLPPDMVSAVQGRLETLAEDVRHANDDKP